MRLLGSLLFCLTLPQQPLRGSWQVEIHASVDGPLLSVRADQAQPLSVLREIARSTDLSLLGSDRLLDVGTLTAYISERPLDQALAWLLGTLGLRGTVANGSLTIADELPPFAPRDVVDNYSELAHLQALKLGPEHQQADQAEFALAEIQERRGDWAAAIKHYEYLSEAHPDSELVAEALWRSANHWAAAQEWNRAAARYTEVADKPEAEQYHVAARIQLALMQCHLESPKKALYILEALEHNYPTQQADDIRRRLLVRARALALSGNAVEALRVLDVLPAYGGSAEDHSVLDVRALALERCGRPADAALAWLSFAKNNPGREQSKAIVEAARLTLLSEDEVGVLLIESWAASLQSAVDLSVYTNEARMRLGLVPPDPTAMTDAQWLKRGEEFVEQRATAEAVQALEPLYHRRTRLGSGERLRLSLAFARALHAQKRGGYAQAVLRDCAASQEAQEARIQVYVLAAELYEADGRFEQALAALQGRLE